ncbi:ABC-type nitrate/sulfonate/bicarbonate transport system, periplasmic component [Opitutaceae bacterium TAV1]|nr:ABC-type nitrate/sulfonate/bicarbonate transport system, periplasmic component [Opitutaceae bacterium TAV1]
MSTATLPTPAAATAAPAQSADAAPVIQANYTICPVLVASNVAVELGWLEEEIKKSGASLHYLGALPESVGFLPHFSHKLDNFFRDGGNIPAIWAKADHTDTRLIGLTAAARSAGHILVRADSGIHTVAGLRGRKFGLYRSLNAGKVDFWRGTGERAIELALALHGLTRKDVEILDLDHDDDTFRRGGKPSEIFKDDVPSFAEVEVNALAEGRVDAIYSWPGRSRRLEATGTFKVIEDLDRHPDWTLGVANSPWTITVNTAFSKEHPEVVVAYLRAAIRAGRWVNANRAAAADILQRVAFGLDIDEVRAYVATLPDFVPDLSAKNLAGIEIEKQFLLSHGYISRDFDVKAWAAPEFLEQARRSLSA